MIRQLDEILLSEQAVERFHQAYENVEFQNWLVALLPEVEDCRQTAQDNPWHIYSCLDHILHSVEEINKQTNGMETSVRRMLAYVMFLHDIGKPRCKIRRFSKAYNREVDSFFNHNHAGVEIAERVLPCLGFDEREVQIMLTLIEKHDVFMSITLTADGNPYHKLLTKALLLEEVQSLQEVEDGRLMMRYLLYIGRADNKAQNPKLTPTALKTIDIMEEMLNELK